MILRLFPHPVTSLSVLGVSDSIDIASIDHHIDTENTKFDNDSSFPDFPSLSFTTLIPRELGVSDSIDTASLHLIDLENNSNSNHFADIFLSA